MWRTNEALIEKSNYNKFTATMSAATLRRSVAGFKLLSTAGSTTSQANGRYLYNNHKRIASFSDIMKAFNSTSATDSSDKPVLFERHGDKGIIILNKPKALNALNLEMARSLEAQLKQWDSDSQIRMVVIKSSSEKAFCAGGDVKYITQSGPDGGRAYFRQEYTVNNLIGSLSIPYVALLNGIVMGGGCGLSVHGNFRVATEKALFAMPETAIGLFPDVGASHFLNKLPGSLGLFFGLTGQRLSGRDLFKAGVATHFIPSDKISTLQDELMRLEKPDLLKIDGILQKYQEQWQDDYRKEFSLKPHIGRINSIFGQAKSVEEILLGLEKDNSEWARKQIEILRRMSPTSVKLTFEQLRRAKTMTLPECLKMEFRMAWRILESKDFYEGVRAVLVDKDNQPKWQPAKLEEVKEADINAFFEPLPYNQELQL